MGGSQRGGGVANVGVATKEEVAGDHREEGGDVMLLELAHASPGIDTHCNKKKRKPSIGMKLTIQRLFNFKLGRGRWKQKEMLNLSCCCQNPITCWSTWNSLLVSFLSQNNKISELKNKSDILTPPAVPFPWADRLLCCKHPQVGWTAQKSTWKGGPTCPWEVCTLKLLANVWC